MNPLHWDWDELLRILAPILALLGFGLLLATFGGLLVLSKLVNLL